MFELNGKGSRWDLLASQVMHPIGESHSPGGLTKERVVVRSHVNTGEGRENFVAKS